jgi:hypothetical protein
MMRYSALFLFVTLAVAGVLIGFLAGWAIPPAVSTSDPLLSEEPLPGRWALLVGVTKYDHLPSNQHLSGPGNDVRILEKLLHRRYRFPLANIFTLTEEGPRRPTRENIVHAFRQLAEQVGADDQVVILLAGHGDRQPEPDPPLSDHPEPDGIDEVFLPADIRPWDPVARRLPNALVDDEIRAWLEALTRKKAHVWAIFDCCHSGHVMRGSEMVRQPSPGTLVPAEELQQARRRAANRKQRRPLQKPMPFVPDRRSDYLVALSACLPHETTSECLFPTDSAQAQYHGLLTWTLVGVLEQSPDSVAPLTYRELVRQIQRRYSGRPGGAPTPTLEGGGQDRVVLGTDRPVRSRLTLHRHESEYRVGAGSLSGLTPGSVLAIDSPGGKTVRPQPLGHVRVCWVRTFDALVEPCSFAGQPTVRELPDLAPCRIVYTDYGLNRFKVAIQAAKGQEHLGRLVQGALGGLRNAETGVIQLVDDLRSADQVIRLVGEEAYLVEASGNRPPHPLGPVRSEQFARRSRDALEVLYRARNLVAASEHLERTHPQGQDSINLAVEVVCNGKALPRPPGGWVFHPGDEVAARVRNVSRSARIHVHLLVVNPKGKIQLMYPGEGESSKLLEPGQVLVTETGGIEPPFGREHLVAIATLARNPPVDFGALLQPGLADRGFSSTSPLAQLLERALYRVGSRSGLSNTEAGEHAVRLLSWLTAPKLVAPGR